MLICFQWSHSNADQGNYTFIPLFAKETQLLLWTGSRGVRVKNTIQLPELKNYIYEMATIHTEDGHKQDT
jgi:hypothetical protein